MATLRACRALGRPAFLVRDGARPSELAAWVVAEFVEVLGVAGNRESTAPGIGERAERFLMAVPDRLTDHAQDFARLRNPKTHPPIQPTSAPIPP